MMKEMSRKNLTLREIKLRNRMESKQKRISEIASCPIVHPSALSNTEHELVKKDEKLLLSIKTEVTNRVLLLSLLFMP